MQLHQKQKNDIDKIINSNLNGLFQHRIKMKPETTHKPYHQVH